MFIELTDLLRCPAGHEEGFLVLIPDRMEGRRVLAGHLGCPACGWTTAWTNGIPDFRDEPATEPAVQSPALEADAATLLLGLSGPGGWIALAGRVALLAAELEARLPGVHIVAINPPAGAVPHGECSVLRARDWPLKTHALRGVVLGADATRFTASAIGSVLPGLRVVGEVNPPEDSELFAVMAVSDGAWVGHRK